jgi:hypothetical protein
MVGDWLALAAEPDSGKRNKGAGPRIKSRGDEIWGARLGG